MPRAPQSRALFAGRPFAKRRVFSSSVSRAASIPLSSDSGTAETAGTPIRPPCAGSQTKASPSAGALAGRAAGDSRSSAAAMRFRRAISAVPDRAFGRFAIG